MLTLQQGNGLAGLPIITIAIEGDQKDNGSYIKRDSAACKDRRRLANFSPQVIQQSSSLTKGYRQRK
jgi:hypothetical protein